MSLVSKTMRLSLPVMYGVSYVPAHLRPNLLLHKYHGTDLSLVSKYLLQPYWTWAASHLPMRMHPNLVTLVGFMFIVLNLLLCVFFGGFDLTLVMPNWVFAIIGINLFLYQTFDAMDGKHARRTNLTSPLGELFDHGIDALNAAITTITLAPAVGLTNNLYLICFLSPLISFYFASWETFHTNVLYFSYVNGPVEGVLTIVGAFMITSFYGPSIWDYNVTFFGVSLQMRILLAINATLFIGGSVLMSIYNVLCVKPLRVLIGTIPMVLFTGSLCVWFIYYPNLFQSLIIPASLAAAFTFGRFVGRIIVAHTIHDSFPLFDISLIPLVVSVLFSKYSSELIVYLWLVSSILLHLAFYHGIINIICSFMKINCFVVK